MSGEKPEYYYKGGYTTYKEGVDPEVTCWHCGKTFLCDCTDATCRLCGAPWAKERCKEFNFVPKPKTPDSKVEVKAMNNEDMDKKLRIACGVLWEIIADHRDGRINNPLEMAKKALIEIGQVKDTRSTSPKECEHKYIENMGKPNQRFMCDLVPIANNGVSLEDIVDILEDVRTKSEKHWHGAYTALSIDQGKAIIAKLQPTAPRGLLINCDKCGEQLKEPGALEFSPPKDGSCQKRHICVNCYNKEPK